MASVYRERGKWTVSYFDSQGKRQYVRGLATKALADQIGQKREFAKQAAKHGLIDVAAERYARESARPFSEQLEDFRAHLTSKKNTAQHIRETVALVKRVFEACGIDRIDAIDRHRIHSACAKLTPKVKVREGKVSHRTQSKALMACKIFAGWLDGAERIPKNPLAKLAGWDAEQDRRRRRRILTDAKMVELVETTETQPTRGGMTGKDRAMRYAIGMGTGLRQGTLFALTPESFHLDAQPPLIKVPAQNMKGRKAVDHPISPDLAEYLREWLAAKSKGKPVFTKLPHAKPTLAYRHDLAAIGVTYNDGDEFYCDQHAQRNAFITAIIRSAGLKVAQDLAHHSTPLLTSRYGQLGMGDYAKAIESLPKLGSRPKGKKRAG